MAFISIRGDPESVFVLYKILKWSVFKSTPFRKRKKLSLVGPILGETRSDIYFNAHLQKTLGIGHRPLWVTFGKLGSHSHICFANMVSTNQKLV